MWKITYDKNKNRITIDFKTTLLLEEMTEYSADVKKAVDRTTPGFTLLVNLIGTEIIAQEVDDACIHLRDYLVLKGIKNTATVVDSAIVRMQMNRTLVPINSNTFLTIKDAERFLDKYTTM